MWQVTDARPGRRFQSGRDEFRDAAPDESMHAERGVPGAHHVAGGIDNLLQDIGERVL